MICKQIRLANAVKADLFQGICILGFRLLHILYEGSVYELPGPLSVPATLFSRQRLSCGTTMTFHLCMFLVFVPLF